MDNPQILVIEDEPEFRANLVEILRSDGWDVIEAASGQAGLEWLECDRPDLVLCDILMPDVDGFRVLKTLRDRMETANIPFIFLTAKTEASDLRRGMNQGADDYLLKPVRRSDLLDTLRIQLQKAQRRQDYADYLAQSQQTIQAQLQMSRLREQESQQWISGITHDLRAPLTTIKVALELIEQAPEKRSHYVTVARQACAQSDALIEEMLTLYRDQDDDLPIESPPVDLKHLLQVLQQTFTARARFQKINLEWNSVLEISPVLGSPLPLQRILTELLNNAFKYTDRSGTIQFQVGILETAGIPSLSIVIRNQAEISPQSMPKIFNKFYRVTDDNPESGLSEPWQTPGSGLGLTIVKNLVTQLNGNLTVTSQAGWTTFTLHLPYLGSSKDDRAIVR